MQKDRWKPKFKGRKWTTIQQANEKDIHQHRAVSRKAKGIKAKEARSVWACRQRERAGKESLERHREETSTQFGIYIITWNGFASELKEKK